MRVAGNTDQLENLELATGASAEEDLGNLLPEKVAADINRYVAENSFARDVFRPNRDLVGAQGLSISYPLKEKTVAHKLSDMGEVLVDQGEFSEVSSEAFVAGAKAQWSYAAEEAQLFDLMAQEIFDALQALVRFENSEVVTLAEAEHASGDDNHLTASTSGQTSYQDIIDMRAQVEGSMDYVVLPPDEMADLLTDDKFIDGDFISTIRQIEPETTVFETNLGITFVETDEVSTDTVLGFASSRAGRLTIKTEPRTQRFDLGENGGALQKGVTVWEMIDPVVTRADAIVELDAS